MEKLQRFMLPGNTPECDSEEAGAAREFLTRIGDKWPLLVIVVLFNAPARRARFSELNKQVAGISHTMLSATLRSLERDGMVTRQVFPEVPPRVEYELTELGLGLLRTMQTLVDWVTTNYPEIKRARAGFDTAAAVVVKGGIGA
jgi:DNA-binding HxlR family transcriptional regulator